MPRNEDRYVNVKITNPNRCAFLRGGARTFQSAVTWEDADYLLAPRCRVLLRPEDGRTPPRRTSANLRGVRPSRVAATDGRPKVPMMEAVPDRVLRQPLPIRSNVRFPSNLSKFSNFLKAFIAIGLAAAGVECAAQLSFEISTSAG